MAAADNQLLTEVNKLAKNGQVTVTQLQGILKNIDPSGQWDAVSVQALSDAFGGEGSQIPVESLVSKYHLQMKISSLQKQLDALTRLSKQGGVGFPEAIKDNAKQPGLQGLVIKVNHVSRICESAEKSKKFYCDILGATVLNRPNFPSPGYWLWLGNVQLHLIEGKHAKEEAKHASGIPTGNVNHYSFEVYDFDAVEAKLLKIKVPFKKNRVPENGQVIHQLFLQDPDGHYIEVCDCNKFSDFVFGPKPDPKAAKELAKNYNEGIDPTGASIAAVAALAFLPNEMKAGSKKDMEDSLGVLQRAFKVFSGGDDHIEAKDMGTILKRMGHQVSDAEVQKFIKEADKDKSGKIQFPEFCKFMAPKLKPDNNKKELQEAFNQIDKDKSGEVTPDELLLMLWGIGQRVDEAELTNAIKKADKNKNGKVNFAEFLELFKGIK